MEIKIIYTFCSLYICFQTFCSLPKKKTFCSYFRGVLNDDLSDATYMY